MGVCGPYSGSVYIYHIFIYMNRDNRIKDDSFYLLKTVGRIQYTLLLYVLRV